MKSKSRRKQEDSFIALMLTKLLDVPILSLVVPFCYTCFSVMDLGLLVLAFKGEMNASQTATDLDPCIGSLLPQVRMELLVYIDPIPTGSCRVSYTKSWRGQHF